MPWSSSSVLRPSSIDFIFSQAVLEHVEDFSYVRVVGGVATPVRAHVAYHRLQVARDYARLERPLDAAGCDLKLIRGRRPYLINRMPHSVHVGELARNGFDIVTDERRSGAPPDRARLAEPFRWFGDEDLSTGGNLRPSHQARAVM